MQDFGLDNKIIEDIINILKKYKEVKVQKYMDMLRDRNLIAHTYKENIAIDIHDRIINNHIKTLNNFIEEFDKKILY